MSDCRQLNLALVQHDLLWGDAAGNRDTLSHLLYAMSHQVDLVILPEMFTSAFDAQATAMAEPWPGETLDWMLAHSRQLDAAITGSIAVIEAGQRFNRLVFVRPDGQVSLYDKRHLFRMMGEHKRYAAGSQRLIVHWRGWRIFPLVCYDLRFPVWCRNGPELDYDLMLCVANWPAPRTLAWRALLKARAIENLAFVAGVNRTGSDTRQLQYEGASCIEAPDATTLLDAGDRPGIYHCSLDLAWLENFRKHFPAHLDADRFRLELD